MLVWLGIFCEFSVFFISGKNIVLQTNLWEAVWSCSLVWEVLRANTQSSVEFSLSFWWVSLRQFGAVCFHCSQGTEVRQQWNPCAWFLIWQIWPSWCGWLVPALLFWGKIKGFQTNLPAMQLLKVVVCATLNTESGFPSFFHEVQVRSTDTAHVSSALKLKGKSWKYFWSQPSFLWTFSGSYSNSFVSWRDNENGLQKQRLFKYQLFNINSLGAGCFVTFVVVSIEETWAKQFSHLRHRFLCQLYQFLSGLLHMGSNLDVLVNDAVDI